MRSSVTCATRSSSKVALAWVRRPPTKASTKRHTGAKASQIQASPYVSHTSLAVIRLCSLVCTKLHNAIGLAFGHRHPLPQVEHDQPALHRCPVQPGTGSIFIDLTSTSTVTHQGQLVQPGTGSIFIDLDNSPGGTQGIAFSQRTDRGVEKCWRGIQFKIGRAGIQGNAPSTRTAQRLFLPTRRAIFDQQSLVKWAPVRRAAAIRTVEGVPVHSILPALLNIRHSAEDTRSRVHQSTLSREFRDITQ